MLQHVGRHGPTEAFQMPHGGFEVGRVPQNDGAGDQVERTRAVALGLEPMIPQSAGAVEEDGALQRVLRLAPRSEEHKSELQSLMRTSYDVFCLKKKKED